jgi:NADPH:quinone reductase-like Zn-dependent oxidoreductase
MSFEEDSVFPMAIANATVAIRKCLGDPKPDYENPHGLLIWGASSSVGSISVQLARTLGFTVFATASPAHHQYIKSLGAFEVFDYHDPSVVSKIVDSAKAAGTPLKLGFDTITEGTTAQRSAEILLASGGKGSKLCLVLEWPGKYPKPDDIEISQTVAMRLGMDLKDLGKWLFNDHLEKALKDKSIIPSLKIEIVPGGISATQNVFEKLKAGVSGTKLVVKVD